MKKYILTFLLLTSVAIAGWTFSQNYYSQQKFFPKTASWNDPIGMFMGEVYFIVEHRDMSDPNRLKIKGPGKIWFGDDDDDDFWLGWDDPNDMGFYAPDSGGASVFHFGTDSNTIDVDLDGDLDVLGTATIGSLTSGRVVYSGAGGLLSDSAFLTYASGSRALTNDNLIIYGGGLAGLVTANTQLYLNAGTEVVIDSSDLKLEQDLLLTAAKQFDWNRGEITLTHSTNTLTYAGLNTYDWGNANAETTGTLDVDGAATLTGIAYPITDGDVNDVMALSAANTLTMLTPTVKVPVVLSFYDAQPGRASETAWNGGLDQLVTAGAIGPTTPGDDLTFDKGVGKFLIIVNTDADDVYTGTITVTGNSVDRDTGVVTVADQDTITIDGITTDSTILDADLHKLHAFTNAYITSKWFRDTIVLSSTTVTLDNVDIYHVSFEQFNDSVNTFTLETFDASFATIAGTPEFAAYLYSLHKGALSTCYVERHAPLLLGVRDGTYAAINNTYYRLRKGNINETLNCATDGIWVDIHYDATTATIEDVTLKIWATEEIPLTLQ